MSHCWLGGELLTWQVADVDSLHVYRNRIVGMNYLGIIDSEFLHKIDIKIAFVVLIFQNFWSYRSI